MSDYSEGPGWWQASDDKWYPPDQLPGPDPVTGSTWTPPAEAPTWGAPPGPAAGVAPYGAPPHGAPGYGPPGYGGPGYGGYAPQGGYAYGGAGLPTVSGQATASMVLGIIALVLFFCWILAVPLAVVGLPIGLIALNKIKRGEASPAGRGMAVAGVVLCSIALVLAVGIGILVMAS